MVILPNFKPARFCYSLIYFLCCRDQTDFQCDDGHCIPSYLRCNGYTNCLFGEDEYNCTCLIDEYLCANSSDCIPYDFRCDHYPDCINGDDEEGCDTCAATEFRYFNQCKKKTNSF